MPLRELIAFTPGTAAAVERISALWAEALSRSGGPFLFGRFGVADAMWAPVATRFHTYRIDLPPVARDWSEAVLGLPAMREWTEAALDETERMPETDALLDRD